MWQQALRFAGKAVPFLKTQTPRLGQAAKWLQSPLNRAYVGGGLGFLTNNEGTLAGRLRGGLMGGALGAIPMPGQGLATRGLVRAGLPLATAGPLANVAIPAAGIALAGNQSQGSIANQAESAVTQSGQTAISGGQNVGSGFLVQNLATGEQFLTGPQNALPGGMGQYGYIPPIGTQADQIDPSGTFSGRRTGTRLDARANAAALNILMPTVRKYAEQRAKDELTRQLAAAGVRQNIATNALLTEISARKDAEMGRRAAEQAGDAVTQNYATYQ